MSIPSEKLAAQIVERLIEEKLVTKQDGAKLVQKLADGKLKAEDWRLPIELSVSKEPKP